MEMAGGFVDLTRKLSSACPALGGGGVSGFAELKEAASCSVQIPLTLELELGKVCSTSWHFF